MATVSVDFSKPVGVIKPVHGVGQPPQNYADFSMFRYLRDAGIPFSRLHDVDSWFGGNLYVDIPNLFRDFDRDETDPANYDFAFTDRLITALIENGIEPFFRLGVSIENSIDIAAYRIFPPTDNEKWARICEMVIRHYTEGWNNGFHYPIRYWEIWNEPDNHPDLMKNPMWRGTKEQYFELYRVASRHLKSCFPHLKIGGYASCGFYALSEYEDSEWKQRHPYYMTFFEEFLCFVKENDCPLDFFSWHSYGEVKETEHYIAYCRQKLDEYGFTATEMSCDEWNPHADLRGTDKHAAMVCAMLLAFQNSSLDTAMFYDACCAVSMYSGMFDPATKKPYPAYYAFTAFNELYKRGTQVSLQCDTDGVYAVAARDDKDGCILIANDTGADVPLTVQTDREIFLCNVSGDGDRLTLAPLPETLKADSFICIFVR